MLGFFNRLVIVLSICMTAGSLFAAEGVHPGSKAPEFELPLLSGEGYLSSRHLFSRYDFTFLVFWESGCPHCVESLAACESFHDEYSGDEITVMGINGDEGDLLRVKGILGANGIGFQQLWDGDGLAARSYGIPPATFTLYLVNGGGLVEARVFDPQGDVRKIMEDMLIGGDNESLGREPPGDGPAGHGEVRPADDTGTGLVFRGLQRIRFLGIDARGTGAVGPYGEEVRARNNLLFRFELEMSRKLARRITVGGLLRVSNEGREVLEKGPEYLGSEWGSAFAEINLDRLSLRLGYYPVFMTPLTLMRWDWDDNPKTGGEAGCGCVEGVGVLLIESLEELAPELVFEGGLAVYRGGDFETRLFYAIPRRAREITRDEVRLTGAEPARYSLEIYGFDGRWQRYDRRTDSFWRAAVNFAGSWENRRSIDFIGLRYAAPDPWYDSFILTVSGEVPVLSSVGLRGEWIVSNRARSHGLEAVTGDQDVSLEGGGGIVGIICGRSPRFEARCDYMRLEPDFYSPFSAISYEKNFEGIRLSSRALLPGDLSAISIFYKRLREVEAVAQNAGKERFSLWGASFDLDLPGGFGASAGWLDRGRWRGGEILGHDWSRKSLSLNVRYRFNKTTYAQVQYQAVNNVERYPGNELESRADLYSVYLTTVF